MDSHQGHRASSHAPIGVMGDHRHKKGEWMLSYRYMRMDMKGSRDGTQTLTPSEIATSVANPFASAPMQPPTLRVVPLNMQMDMYMLGAMYGLSDRVTLLAMTSYRSNTMDHVTFQGSMGTTELGTFSTKSSGFGDTTLGAMLGLTETDHHSTHLGLAISLPTGSITQTDDILNPMGGRPNVRLPYAMQLGSGSFDLKPSVTYLGRAGEWSWGAQAGATLRLNKNDEDYSRGDRLDWTGWLAYDIAPAFSLSARMIGQSEGSISGQDANIAGPVQTADPDNYGGESIEIGFGANLVIPRGTLKGHRIALEYALPIYRDLSGPQLETDSLLTLGWQKAF